MSTASNHIMGSLGKVYVLLYQLDPWPVIAPLSVTANLGVRLKALLTPRIPSPTALVLLKERPIPKTIRKSSLPTRLTKEGATLSSLIATQYINGGPMALNMKNGARYNQGLLDKAIGSVNSKFSTING